MSGAMETAKPLRKLFWATQALLLLYFAVALACLRQWNTANPWSRLDRFSGGYLLLRAYAARTARLLPSIY